MGSKMRKQNPAPTDRFYGAAVAAEKENHQNHTERSCVSQGEKVEGLIWNRFLLFIIYLIYLFT